jgi:hypothetical protein
MDDKRKDLMAAGLYLGDVTLVLAAIAKETPSYVVGFELERVIPDAEKLEPARREADSLLAGRDDIEEIPPEVLRKILDTAIENGKFHSASRCLSLLGERDAYVEKFLGSAGEKLKSGGVEAAARDIAIASNLESDTGFPLFQYSGPELHAGCETAPESCLTRAPLEEGITKALNYLLEGEKVLAFADGLSGDEKRNLLPHVALERDPHVGDFYAAYARAHKELGEIEAGEIEGLRADVKRAAEVTANLARFLGGASPATESSGPALERARRMAGGFGKDFEGVDALLSGFQLRRIKRRIGNLLESEEELKAARDAVKQGVGDDAIASTIALIEEFTAKGLLDKIDELETRLVHLQVGLLGRPVHSQEHWQYLRELAFKYPAGPIMCCIRRLNDRYMVVPRWDSELAGLLRGFFERASANPA